MPFSQARFSVYARELSKALLCLSEEARVTSIKVAASDRIHLNGDTVKLYPMASHEEIVSALARIDSVTKGNPMSVTGFEPGAIRAKLDALKDKARQRRAQSMAKLDAAHDKVASVDAEIEKIAAQIEKEADDGLQEFAEFTNGGPL